MTGLGINFQGSTLRGASADLPRTSPNTLYFLEPVVIIMTMIKLNCYSFSPHDFTREHAHGHDKNLITRSLVVVLTRFDKEYASDKDG